MSYVLRVDGERWRAHTESVRDSVQAVPGVELVPVAKGGGYGLGQARLLAESARLGVAAVAVGTVGEAAEALREFAGDVLVLEPYEPRDDIALAEWERLEHGVGGDPARLIRTLSSAGAAAAASTPRATPVRAVLEGLTSVRRFGLDEPGLVAALDQPDVLAALDTGALVLEGLALHLPLAPGVPSRVDQVTAWGRRWQALLPRLPDAVTTSARRVWVSHLTDEELAAASAGLPHLDLRPRIGTRLWLGDRGALQASGTVLAVHPYDGTVAAGYRQRTGPRDGTLVVVAGGTAHGVALEAPSPAATLRQRAVAAGGGALEAVGRALSPFRWAGKQRWFAEPPHQHVSLLWLPRGCVVPAVGDQLTADARLTTAHFDAIIGLD